MTPQEKGRKAGAVHTADAEAKRKDAHKAYLAHVERTYGITPEEYRALYRAQGGRCYVCRIATGPTKKNPKARHLGVDHDHLTGEVRGLVCTGSRTSMTCNRLIAIFNRLQLMRGAAMLSDPPPARIVLATMRLPEFDPATTPIPPMVEGVQPFTLAEVRGVAA